MNRDTHFVPTASSDLPTYTSTFKLLTPVHARHSEFQIAGLISHRLHAREVWGHARRLLLRSSIMKGLVVLVLCATKYTPCKYNKIEI